MELTQEQLEQLAKIARKHLFIETLETKNTGEDFHDLHVAGIKEALKAAFVAGQDEETLRVLAD